MSRLRTVGAAAGLALALAAYCAPAAAQTYSWSLTGLDSGSGTFFTTAQAGGGLDVVGFTGTIDGVSVTEIGGNPGGQATSPAGAYYYDNLVFPSGDPLLDIDGMLLSYNGGEANLYANSALPFDYAFLINGGAQNFTGDEFAIQFVPEPSSMAVVGAGILGLGLATRRRRRA